MAVNFRHRRTEDPEINLIPFIDVLLVILIFLMLTTTYSKFTELRVNLPVADAEKARNAPKEIIVAVSADGRFSVNKQAVDGRDVTQLASVLANAAAGSENHLVIISADANATHQSVITVLDAARRAGLPQLTFATQSARGAARAGDGR
ncbi:ExbD/TolR family protein [Rivibacter subsaxonicus]|uniref:Biopolymer transport protein ExbD n=1 Tax=Rivibacter subsaxonicus TaxID=457575 RepID=A0A4Q7VNK8_9BURK|nr:biopolymer transporter ExbD [Rivibacter subsaxonicus]RZT97966.1 biopolymer transport protein ExbD [Rivibacter subsaxonicus]